MQGSGTVTLDIRPRGFRTIGLKRACACFCRSSDGLVSIVPISDSQAFDFSLNDEFLAQRSADVQNSRVPDLQMIAESCGQVSERTPLGLARPIHAETAGDLQPGCRKILSRRCEQRVSGRRRRLVRWGGRQFHWPQTQACLLRKIPAAARFRPTYAALVQSRGREGGSIARCRRCMFSVHALLRACG